MQLPGFEAWVIEAEPIRDLISVGLISSWPELGCQAQVWLLGFQIKNTMGLNAFPALMGTLKNIPKAHTPMGIAGFWVTQVHSSLPWEKPH